jgi:hypothetical protein
MSVTLQLDGGGSGTLDEFGIVAATLTQTHQAVDTLQINARQRFTDSPLVVPFARAILRVDGTVRFIGWLDAEPCSVTGSAEWMGYTFAGPWRWLLQATYLGDNKIGGSISAASSGRYTLGQEFTESESGISASRLTVRAQLIRLLDAAVTASGNAFTYAALPSDFLNFQAPTLERVDDLHGNAIRALLGYAPGTVMWWEYNGTTPRLHFGDFAALSAAHTLTATQLLQASPRRLIEQLVGKVRIVHLRTTDAGTTRSERVINSAGDALSLGATREITYTFSDDEAPAEAFAQAFATWHQTLHVAASAQFNELAWTRRPGDQWTFGGKFARLAGKRATCQQITRDLFRRTETITLGAPPAPVSIGRRASQIGAEDATPGGGGGGGGGEETGSGSITVNVSVITDESADETAGLDQTLITVGDQTKRPTGGSAVFDDLPVGSYAVTVATSGGYRLADTVNPGDLSGITVTDGGNANVSIEITHISRLVLFSDDGAGDARSAIIDLTEFPTEIQGLTRPQLKLRVVDAFVDGEFLKVLDFVSEPYEPEE